LNVSKDVANYSVSLINDKVHGCYANVTVQTFVDISKMLIYGKIKVPENKDDQKFQKTIADTVIDFEKALKGVKANFFASKVVEEVLKSSNNDFNFPLKKVS
jgi:hypothetical protein